MPRFVIRAGSLPPGTTEPIAASGAGERNVGGFVIWKNGRTAVFRHPDQYFSKPSSIIRRHEKTSYSKEVFQQKTWFHPR